MPPHGCVQEAMLFKYTVFNRTSLVQEVEAAIEPSDAFMLAGSTQVCCEQTSVNSIWAEY